MRVAWILLLAAACGGDGGPDLGPDGPTPPGDAASDGSGGGGETGASGRITVKEVSAAGGTNGSFFAEMMVGGLPVWHTETLRMGDCRLLAYQPPFCDPPCSFEDFCAAGGTCQPYPTYVSAGRITVSGLKTALAADPGGCSFCSGQQYQAPGILPGDLFADDATVAAVAEGATFPAFSVESQGVPPLAATFTDDKIVVSDGVDETITWTPAGGDARVRLTLNANNAGHGAPYAAIIVCETSDSGQLVVPGAMIAAFPATMAWQFCGGSDCPPSSLMRYRRGTTETSAGPVELLVGSEILFGVDH